jgi:hypothetical protein
MVAVMAAMSSLNGSWAGTYFDAFSATLVVSEGLTSDSWPAYDYIAV